MTVGSGSSSLGQRFGLSAVLIVEVQVRAIYACFSRHCSLTLRRRCSSSIRISWAEPTGGTTEATIRYGSPIAGATYLARRLSIELTTRREVPWRSMWVLRTTMARLHRSSIVSFARHRPDGDSSRLLRTTCVVPRPRHDAKRIGG